MCIDLTPAVAVTLVPAYSARATFTLRLYVYLSGFHSATANKM